MLKFLYRIGPGLLKTVIRLLTRIKVCNHSVFLLLFLKKRAITGLFFYLFLSFQTNIIILQKNKCEKCPSSIQCWDSNPRPLEHESPPITNKPGLPPSYYFYYAAKLSAVRDRTKKAKFVVVLARKKSSFSLLLVPESFKNKKVH